MRRRVAAGRSPKVHVEPSALPPVDGGFDAHRNSTFWYGGAPVRAVDLLVGESIENYTPRVVPTALWDEVADQARQWAAMVPTEFTKQAVNRLKPLAQYLAWRVDSGMDVTDPFLVFQADDLEYWLATACGHLSGGTRSTYRSALRTIGEHVVGSETACPDRTVLYAKPDPRAPYSRHEFAAVLSAIRGLRSAAARHDAMAILVPSRGAGLLPVDITGRVGTDIKRVDGGVVIDITGPRPRQVPVLASWENEILRLAKATGDRPLFRPDRTRITDRDIERFCKRLKWIDAPKLTASRCRSTWIVEHLTAGTPIHVLAEAAGTTASNVARYAKFVEPVTPEAAHQLLRLQREPR